MFAACGHRMLASMSGTDPRADTPLNWSNLGVSELPTGTVTLLLADVEGSTRLWQTQPEQMTAAIARLDRSVCEVISAHDGVRPVEQGEGDSFVVAFARASNAVACALELQRAPLAPIRLRIGVHTGEVQLRDEGNYIGTTVNRTARLRDLAHGGQTVLSGTTEDLVLDRLPADAWLTDLGSHQLRDLPRLERVVQLCHPDLRNDFPPLRARETVVAQHLPVQFTSFVGREAEIEDVRQILADNRFVTLTGAGGVGKTRLAVQVAADIARGFGGGVWLVDLAPITDPENVADAVIRALGLPDQPGSSAMGILLRFVGDRRMLLVLDNCEHLLDASAALVVALLGGCPAVTVMATSREPIRVAGEVSWRVPSLSLADEAIELFTDRARRVRPDFRLADEKAAIAAEICRRTRAAASSIASGMPSRRRQISATVAALSSVSRKSGRTRRARSVNNSIASSASDSDGTRQLTSPATPIGSRLVARTVTAGQPPSRPTTSAAHASSRCSQLSSTSSIRRSPTNRSSVSIVERPGWSGRPSARITATGTRSGSVIGARSTYHTPSPNPPAISVATCTARRVLPTPPAPVSVTSRLSARICRTSFDFGVAADETRELHRKMLGDNGFSAPAAAGTRCEGRDGTAAPPVPGAADRAADGCPGRSARRRPAAGRQPDLRWCPTARSGRRAPDRAAVRSG